MNDDMQYKWGTSSVQMRIWSTGKAHHQVLNKAGVTQRCFKVILSSLWQDRRLQKPIN